MPPQIQTPVRKLDHGTTRVDIQRQQVANLIAAGKTYAEIAKVIGKSVSRVGAIADELRGKERKPTVHKSQASETGRRFAHNRIAPDLEAKARELLRDGVAGKAVAKRLGISQSAAYRVLSEVRPVARVSSKPNYRKIRAEADAEREARLAAVRLGVQGTNGEAT